MRSTLDPTLDVVFKLLFGAPQSQDILVALLTAVLRPSSPITTVTVLNPELPREHVTDRGIVLDLLVALQSSCGPSSQLPRFAGLQGCGGPTGFVVKGAVDVDPRRAGSPGGAQRQRAGRRM